MWPVFALSSLLTVLLSVALAGCLAPSKEKDSSAAKLLKICCTTSIVEDAVKKIAGGNAHVYALMGPGIDPHSYKASQGDLEKLREADIIFYNGLHLEGKMVDILEKLKKQHPVYALSDSVPVEELLYYGASESPDPHLWFDPMLWSKALGSVYQGLSSIDPENEERYRNNLIRFRKELGLLHAWAEEELNKIPDSNRYLITSHDAFQYFSRAYSIEVRALQGVSSSVEFGLRDMVELVDFVSEKQIPAIFTESSIPVKFIESVQEACKKKGHHVKIGGTLYSDALGEPGTYLGTYLGVFHHNVEQISTALVQ